MSNLFMKITINISRIEIDNFISMGSYIHPYIQFIKYIGDVRETYFEIYGDMMIQVEHYENISYEYLIAEHFSFL